MSIKTITPAELSQLHQTSGAVTVIDVREPDEFSEVSAPIAKNYPLSRFDPADFASKHDKLGKFFMLCRSGQRSLRAAQMLEAQGFGSVFNVTGGMIAWESAGLPVIRKK
jgi:rhodanese-related sulfurtransferase